MFGIFQLVQDSILASSTDLNFLLAKNNFNEGFLLVGVAIHIIDFIFSL